MANRKQNERRFPNWEELPEGGRRYYRTLPGKISGYARYVKVVDANEVTLSIVQEIFDENDRLVAIHQKYPKDTGHQAVGMVEGDTE